MHLTLQVESPEDDYGWGCVVNFQKKANQKVSQSDDLLCTHSQQLISFINSVTSLCRGQRRQFM